MLTDQQIKDIQATLWDARAPWLRATIESLLADRAIHERQLSAAFQTLGQVTAAKWEVEQELEHLKAVNRQLLANGELMLERS
ncbi:MAG TPA: hypothetical protein VHN11_00350 [Xanthobacteraceae bacterium]|jgi:hypothetical protein|nr:hypothetical protein [Xanthobacteraceae bacterium]